MADQIREINLIDAFERVPVTIVDDLKKGSVLAAKQIAKLIRDKQAQGQPCVWG